MIRKYAAACALLLTLSPLAARADQAGFLYTYAINESRYGDFIYSLDAYKPLGDGKTRVRPFVDVFGNIDTKTAGGEIPRIYSDNYAGGAIGVQYTNDAGLRLFIQGGATSRVGSIASVPSGGDVRGGAQLYREWGGLAHQRLTYGNFYGSGTYYSRYQDTVFYNQLEIGRLTSRGARASEIYLRPVVTFDTRAFYYDEVVEVTGGVRFHPFGAHGPTLALEEAAGLYTHTNSLPRDTRSSYFDFRPTIAYGVSL